MLSIIVCHRDPILLANLKKNIEVTAGISFELIVIDNTQNQHSIFSAYNEGVRKSKFPFLCFAHEDILFSTNGWGKKVVEHFRDEQVGMIGVSGSMVLPAVPCPWWYAIRFGYFAADVVECRKEENKTERKKLFNNPNAEYPKTEVVVADGLWFCIRQSLFDKIKFDEIGFSGFHIYDADISMQVRQHSKVYVVYDILIEHGSQGKPGHEYYANLLKFTRKWKSALPVTTNNLTTADAVRLGEYALREVILYMNANGFSRKQLNNVVNEFFFSLKPEKHSLSQRIFFSLSRIIGYRLTNSIMIRVSKV